MIIGKYLIQTYFKELSENRGFKQEIEVLKKLCILSNWNFLFSGGSFFFAHKNKNFLDIFRNSSTIKVRSFVS